MDCWAFAPPLVREKFARPRSLCAKFVRPFGRDGRRSSLRSREPAPRRFTLTASGLPLFVQECVEHGLLDVHFVLAPGGSMKGFTAPQFSSACLFRQVVLGSVVAERHVARERTHRRERTAQLSDHLRR